MTIAYCGNPPLPETLIFAWNLDPALIAGLATWAVALWVYGRGSWSGWVGWALAVTVFVSPLCNLTSALFSVRVLHHTLLTAAIVPLTLLAVPASRRAAVAARLPVAVVVLLHAAAMWAWHAPGPYMWALSTVWGYWLMQATLAGSAVAVWVVILSGARGAGMFAAGGTFLQMGLLGAIIVFARTPLYAVHFGTTEAWGLTPLADQQLAGLLMWAPAAGPYLAAVVWHGVRLLDDPAPVRSPGRAA